jgi:protein-disulfide isomerase
VDLGLDLLEVRWRFSLTGIHPHPRSRRAAAAEAAAQQGRFWDTHGLLLRRQRVLEDGDLRGYAVQFGLDLAAFERDRSSKATPERIQRGVGSGPDLGPGARDPTLFICGVVRHGGYDPPTLLTALVPMRPPTSASWSGGDR